MSPKQVAKLLSQIDRYHTTAMHAQLRYTWRPDTETGRKALHASQRASFKMLECVEKLGKGLCPGEKFPIIEEE